MRDLTFDEFSVAWSTYWGRREIGIVVDNALAMRIEGRTQSLRGYHEQWRGSAGVLPARGSTLAHGYTRPHARPVSRADQ